MAANNENSRLIIPWIIDALDNNRFPSVLKWFDHKRMIFELQWYHQRRAGWCEKYIKLFEAWAKYKGRFTREEKPKVLKLRFRNALRSKRTQLKKVTPPAGKNKFCQYWKFIEPESDISSEEDSDTSLPSFESTHPDMDVIDLQTLQPVEIEENVTISDSAIIDESISTSYDTVCGQNTLSTLFQSSTDLSEELSSMTYSIEDSSMTLFKGVIDFYDDQMIDEIAQTDISTFINLTAAKD